MDNPTFSTTRPAIRDIKIEIPRPDRGSPLQNSTLQKIEIIEKKSLKKSGTASIFKLVELKAELTILFEKTQTHLSRVAGF